ncbi:DUF998 domain-containing protein [Actinomyces faecalis]|uniref:DUF998 domain-containing protein n=1 Tax=Actinomyces faecalis TaxID=2722820 RepID=UPI00155754D6|nr:DUF998 domain-containing protein [Actinomyces faecalis]
MLAIGVILAYNTWLAWPLNGNPRAMTGYLSELAASDQPYFWFFRGGDLVSALLFAVVAWSGQWAWWPWLGRWAPRTAGALGVASVATALDCVAALPCAESHDAVCKATPSLARDLHAVTSTCVSLAFLATFLLVLAALVESGGWSRTALVVAGVGAACGLLMLTSAIAPWVALGTHGVVQAIQVFLCSAWVAWLAWQLDDGSL